MQGATALEMIRRGARQHADRVALVCGDERLTFAEVDALSNRLARAFAEFGLKTGTRVALLLNNSLYSAPLDFAFIKAGVIRVPLNSRLTVGEHARMLEDAGCEALLYGPDLAPRAEELVAARPRLHALGLAGASGDFLDVARGLSGAHFPREAAPEETLLTIYTSGTTGVLKAAQHSQASWAAITRNVLLNMFPATPEDSMLHAASLIHASGCFVLPLWLRGGTTIVLPGFVPAPFLAAVERHRPTAVHVVPTMLQMLLEEPSLTTRDLSSLKRIIYGASPMPRAVIERAIARFGRDKFWQYFGQTEAPLCIAVLRPEEHVGERLGACGQPALDVEIKLVDAAGGEAASGEPGEIWVRGPIAATGYYNAPALSAETFLADGWVRTRDIGVLDAEGFLHLRDRTSDMIVTGGYNVYPREVEDALIAHPDVRECAVVGAPDDKWVEAVVAIVALRPGGTADEAQLQAFVGERVAAYKKPRRIHFVEAIPKTAVGKLDRKLLRAQLRPR